MAPVFVLSYWMLLLRLCSFRLLPLWGGFFFPRRTFEYDYLCIFAYGNVCLLSLQWKDNLPSFLCIKIAILCLGCLFLTVADRKSKAKLSSTSQPPLKILIWFSWIFMSSSESMQCWSFSIISLLGYGILFWSALSSILLLQESFPLLYVYIFFFLFSSSKIPVTSCISFVFVQMT